VRLLGVAERGLPGAQAASEINVRAEYYQRSDGISSPPPVACRRVESAANPDPSNALRTERRGEQLIAARFTVRHAWTFDGSDRVPDAATAQGVHHWLIG